LETSFVLFRKLLSTIRKSVLTLNLKKFSFAQHEVKFVGHIIRSGQRRADSDKLSTVNEMKPPENKKQVRQIFGIFLILPRLYS